GFLLPPRLESGGLTADEIRDGPWRHLRKSFVASALPPKACRDGNSAFYTRAAALFREMHNSAKSSGAGLSRPRGRATQPVGSIENSADGVIQFAIGVFSACSTTITSMGPFFGRRARPSCSWIAVKSSG